MADTVEKSAIVLDVATGMTEEAVKIQIMARTLHLGPDEQEALSKIAKNIRGWQPWSAIAKDLRTVKGQP
jgi:hypothetical protein